MILPGEVDECRKYIEFKFPGFWEQSGFFRQEKSHEVREVCLAAGYERKVIQLALRRIHYFYIQKENIYPPTETFKDKYPNGWTTYTVIEKWLDVDGGGMRTHVFAESGEKNLKDGLWAIQAAGHFVGTQEEVEAAIGLVRNEKPCGHFIGTCRCEDGLIIDEMYEVSRKGKPPVKVQYIRCRDPLNGKHEFRSLDGETWVSVRPEDVKERVKGKFRDVSGAVVERKSFETHAEIRDGKPYARCNVCGDMVQVVRKFRYAAHQDPATKQHCSRSLKSVGTLDDGANFG